MQLKCFKCLCLWHRGSRSHRAHPKSVEFTPGCITDREKGQSEQGHREGKNSSQLVDRTHVDRDQAQTRTDVLEKTCHENVSEQGHGCEEEGPG